MSDLRKFVMAILHRKQGLLRDKKMFFNSFTFHNFSIVHTILSLGLNNSYYNYNSKYDISEICTSI